MSTALNNAVKRKTHKERAQPSGRKKLGLLEKRKDYRERAQDYHKKEQTIKRLRHKAEERNPDEFYFAMQNTRTKGGVHVVERTKANKFSQEELRLMKTQDAAYLSLKAQTEAKKMERLKTTLHLIGTPAQNKHTLFVDDEEEAAAWDPAQHFDTPEELLDRTFNRPRTAQLQAPLVVAGPGGAERRRGGGAGPSGMISKQARRRDAQYRELMQRAERQEKLASLSAKMSFDKQLMGKGRKRKLTTPAAEDSEGPAAKVFKWKQERKR